MTSQLSGDLRSGCSSKRLPISPRLKEPVVAMPLTQSGASRSPRATFHREGSLISQRLPTMILKATLPSALPGGDRLAVEKRLQGLTAWPQGCMKMRALPQW